MKFSLQPSCFPVYQVFARQITRIFRFITPLSVGTIAAHQEAERCGATLPNVTDNPVEQQQPANSETREMDDNERRLRQLGNRDVSEVVEAFIKANTKRKKRKV